MVCPTFLTPMECSVSGVEQLDASEQDLLQNMQSLLLVRKRDFKRGFGLRTSIAIKSMIAITVPTSIAVRPLFNFCHNSFKAWPRK